MKQIKIAFSKEIQARFVVAMAKCTEFYFDEYFKNLGEIFVLKIFGLSYIQKTVMKVPHIFCVNYSMINFCTKFFVYVERFDLLNRHSVWCHFEEGNNRIREIFKIEKQKYIFFFNKFTDEGIEEDECTTTWKLVKCTYRQDPEIFFFPWEIVSTYLRYSSKLSRNTNNLLRPTDNQSYRCRIQKCIKYKKGSKSAAYHCAIRGVPLVNSKIRCKTN